MTREEAIQAIQDILDEATANDNSVCYVTEDDKEPLEMAKEALEVLNGECSECEHIGNKPNEYPCRVCMRAHYDMFMPKSGAKMESEEE